VATAISPAVESERDSLHAFWGLGLLFGFIKVAIQVIANIVSQHVGYGIFRDEMYYLICGQRLAFGYVDQPPMVALQARLTQVLFGFDHMWSLRLLSGLAGGAKVFLTALLVRALGGSRAAAAVAMFAVMCVPVYLSIDGFLSMNSFEPVFWMTAMLALVELARRREPALSARAVLVWWVVLGVSAGLGLENKHTEVFYLVCLLGAMLVTPARRLLRTRGCALGVSLIVLLALPNFLWQVAHHFPTWEWLETVQHSEKDIHLPPVKLFLGQVLMLGPWNALLWISGLIWLLVAGRAREWRFAGVAYLLFLAWMMRMHAKDYYLAPAYPVLFAAGAVAWVRWPESSRVRTAMVWSYVGLVLVGTVVIAPYALPVLAPRRFLAYENAIGFHPDDVEKHDATLLPQFYADRFGWTELLDKVSAVYDALPVEERARTGIFAVNYGEASALNLFGPQMGLPVAISGHQNYWLWGPHGYSGEEMILVVQDSPAHLNQYYHSCTLMARRTEPLAMPWERGPIYLCKGRKVPIFADWDEFKGYR
jgi:hypothetical protein